MDILLYNPLSRNGKNEKFIQKIIKHLKDEGRPVVSYSVLAIDDVDAFVAGCQPDDRIIIVGGDGTINHLANRIYDLAFTQDICVYQAGTGNDFVRSLKTKAKVIPIKKYLKHLPKVNYQTSSRYFLNGVGAGLDGYIGHLVNHSRFKKNKINYFRHAFEGFAKFKPFSGKVIIDGKEIIEKKMWFVSVMNSPYYGGGMKIAPNADRLKKELDVVIVKDIPKWLLMIIFPTIYLGWHKAFKRYVSIHKADTVETIFDLPTYLQIDGDTIYPIETFNVSKAI